MKDTGGPAFPVKTAMFDCTQSGMTLRDYFAAKALMGMMASRNPNSPRFHPDDDAAYVYAVADAMLRARGPHD
jgi:hypothetical protein